MKQRQVQTDWAAAARVLPADPSPGYYSDPLFRTYPAANTPVRPVADEFSDGHARATALSIPSIHKHGELYVQFLKARKAAFIDGRGWDLPQTDGMEFDQYDTPQSRWVVVHEYGEILAGVRATPTIASCGIYTYMIRDAQRGLLENIRDDLLFFEAPVNNRIWEASRIFLMPQVAVSRRRKIQKLLFRKLIASLCEQGATHAIGLVPGIWARWIRPLSLSGFPAGPVVRIGREPYQVAMMNLRKNL